MGQVYGLRPLAFSTLKKEIGAGVDQARDALDGFVGKVATRLLAMINHVENAIPKYEEYVKSQFDEEMVRKELIDKDWTWFADEWVHLSKLSSVAKVLTNDTTTKFEVQHKSTSQACDRVLAAGKTFVSVVSTVKLILVTLPASSKGTRADLIDAQLVKAKCLPQNLIDYLNRERKKCGSAKAK